MNDRGPLQGLHLYTDDHQPNPALDFQAFWATIAILHGEEYSGQPCTSKTEAVDSGLLK